MKQKIGREMHVKRAGEGQKVKKQLQSTTFLLPSFSNLPNSMSNCTKDKNMLTPEKYTHLYHSVMQTRTTSLN